MKKKALIMSLIILYAINVKGQIFKPTATDLKLSKTKTVTPRLRNTGIGFLCFGIATIAGGAAMVSAANGVTYYSNTNYNGVSKAEGSFSGAMGALGIVGGSISVLGGGLMAYFGQQKLIKAKRIQQNVSLNFTPFSGRIMYRF
jgi:hypothetical protein